MIWLSTASRVWASPATDRNTAASNCSGAQGAYGAASQRWQAAMNSAALRARMYSPLNAASFLTSKKAGALLTSASRNCAASSA